MNRDAWAAFHDGSIASISGSVPGDISIGIEILYLREMFRGAGGGFLVRLGGCTQFEYQPFDQEPVAELSRIEQLAPRFLYLLESATCIEIDCTEGQLRLAYSTASLFLDDGRAITDEELLNANSSYWSGARGRAKGTL